MIILIICNMKFYNIKINSKDLNVVVSDTQETRYKGLSDLKKLGKQKGMLFIFPEATIIGMVMRDMNFDLDFIFVNDKWEVTQLETLDKDEEYGVQSDIPIQMVIEVNKGFIQNNDIKVGDILQPEENLEIHLKGVTQFKHGGKFEMVGDKVYEVTTDDIEIDPTKLQILNNDGEVVANIESGSRIFSRIDTKLLIEKFKKKDIIGLAETMIKAITRQNSQKQDYVTK